MFPQFTQNFDFPPASTNDLNDEKVFAFYHFIPAVIPLTAIIVFAARMNSIIFLTHNLVYVS